MVTPSSIPNSTTQGPNVNLSSKEGSEEVLEDSKDEPVIKMRVSNFDEDGDGSEQETQAIGMCFFVLGKSSFSFLPVIP